MTNSQGKWEKFEGSKDDWDRFISSSNGNFRQLYEWGEQKKTLGWKVLRFAFKEDKIILSNVQILGRKKLFTFNAYIPGGVNGDLKYLDEDFIEEIKSYFKTNFF